MVKAAVPVGESLPQTWQPYCHLVAVGIGTFKRCLGGVNGRAGRHHVRSAYAKRHDIGAGGIQSGYLLELAGKIIFAYGLQSVGRLDSRVHNSFIVKGFLRHDIRRVL